MTEMLGVLAIIGVLSIGAIAGFRYAINKNKANNIIYDMNMVMNEINTREIETISSSGSVSDIGVVSEYMLTYAKSADNLSFSIKAQRTNESICKHIMDSKNTYVKSVTVNDVVDGPCAATETNTVAYTFDYPIKAGATAETSEQPKTPSCTSGWDDYHACCNEKWASGSVSLQETCCSADEDVVPSYYGEGSGCCPKGYHLGTYDGWCVDSHNCRYGNPNCDAGCPGSYDDEYECCFDSDFGVCKNCNPNESEACCRSNNREWNNVTRKCCSEDERLSPDKNECIKNCSEDERLSSSGNECIKNCSNAQFLVDNQCITCPANATCNGETAVCNNSGFLYEDSGVYACCDINHFLNNGIDCITCPANATCNGETAVCNDSGVLYESWTGYVCCNKNQYINETWGRCVDCPANATCNGSNVNCTSGEAQDDQNGYIICLND